MSEQYIGNYRVVNLVGRGGMGSVYLAVHRDVPNLRVILKILSDPRLADRFKQEADKLALLDGHPNICQIKHFFDHEGDLVIAMEYIDGTTLDHKIKSEGRLPIAEGARIASDMLAILAYAHQRGISHRDIKPSNVMIDKSGQVKIIDFGIAKGKTDPNLTTTGASLGTPNYMAPEQFIPQADTDYALADIYAVGTTLFLMLTGELPFKADNEFILRDAKLSGKVPSPRGLNPGISKDLEKIILKALDKEPSKRFASAEEMRKALQVTLREEKHHAEQPTQAVETGAGTGPSILPPKKRKSRKPVYIVGGLGVVILAVALLWFVGGPSETGGGPQAPQLLAPSEGAAVKNDQPIVLRWTPTLRDGGVYKVEYTPDTSFDSPLQMRTPEDSAAFPPGVPPGTYRWRVTAMTEQGVVGEPSAVRLLTVEGAATQGTLVVAVAPSGDVYLDDRQIGSARSEVSVTVDTGLYQLRVENSRSVEKVLRDTVRVTADGAVRKVFAFSAPSGGGQAAQATTTPSLQPAAKSGEVRVGSKPRGAAIYVDGERQGVQTNNTLWLKPGRHVVEVALTLDGQERRKADTLMVASDSVHKVLFDFEQ